MVLINKVVLVTGGTRMGAAVASALASRGADVALTYRTSRDEAARTAAMVRERGQRAELVQADLRLPEDCQRAIDTTVSTLGRLDVLVNMASSYRSITFDALTDQDWNDQLTVDLTSAFRCARAAVPHMRRAGGGRIINFADWVARSGRPRYPGYLAYYVAKAGVIALTEALALELARDQILVNAIAPGPIVALPGATQEESRQVERATPLGRWGGEEEIAKAVLALIDSDFMTGETIRVDGGRHLK